VGSILAILATGVVGYLLTKKRSVVTSNIAGYRQISNVKLTYYYVADLTLGSVPVYDKFGNFVIGISSASMTELILEGSGKLPDGRILNYYNGSRWSVLSPGSRPFGSYGNRLTEMGSIAVDPKLIQLGSVVYISALGIWVTAEDIGRAIKGAHIDLFTGTKSKARQYSSKTSTDLVVFDITVQ